MQTFTNHKSFKKENTVMTAISVILPNQTWGRKSKQRKNEASCKNMSNNGFTTRVAEGFSGPTAWHLAVQVATENWATMGAALTKMAADPEFIEWQQNRRKNPVGHMVARAGFRTVYGEPQQWAQFPVSYYRRYKMPKSNLKKAIELVGEIDSIKTMKDHWAISAAVPVTGAEMEMFLAAYQFKSLEVMGQCLDEIGTSEQMQDIVTRASELGNILTADVAITVA